MARLRRDDELDSSLSEDTCPPIQLDIGHGDATPTRGRLNGIEETTGVRVEYDDMKKKNDLTTESLFLPSEGSLGDLPAKDGGNGGPLGKTNHGHVGSIRAITAALSSYIQHNFILSRLLTRGTPSESRDGRKIYLDTSRISPLIDERSGKEYINNAIRSSRYTLLTFLPYQLYFQFSKIANLYFLITGIIQLIPGLSTTGTYTTILPLLFFLLFTVAREGYDDFRRYQLDKEENKRTSRVLVGHGSCGNFRHERYTLPDFSVRLMRFWGRMKDKQERKSILESFSAYQRNPKPETSSGEQPQFSPWVEVKWIDIKVGDIIELSRDESVPADLILLYADGREGVAYVETMALDGETNLKTRHSIHQWSCESIDDISQARALFVVEDPSADLYEFSGKVSLDNTTFPLNLSNTLLRGCIVRNTNRVVGMVINTGEECKIRMNASKNPDAKAPAIQLTTNLVVILLAIFVVLLAVGCTVGYVIWKRTFEVKAWYLARAGVRLIDIFVAFAIMFNNLIPLALYVSLELIKFAQFLLLRDIEMYDEASNTPMVSNTQNIYENLGQINYILSDKTGTLTENVMKLRKMTIGGEIWLHDGLEGSREDTKEAVGAMRETPSIQVDGVGTPRITIEMPTITQDAADPTCARQGDPETYGNIMRYLESNPTTALAQRLSQFALCLAICHTAYPEAQDSGKTGFQAASPDELALVEASQDLGYLLIDRTTHSITLLTSSTRETYEVLHVIEFSSKRKRMSIIVKLPNGKICLICKGADSVLLPRLRIDLMVEEKLSLVRDRRLERVSMEVEEALSRKSSEVQSRKSFQQSRTSFSIAQPGPPTRSHGEGYFGRRSMSIIEPVLLIRSKQPSHLTVEPQSPSIPRRSMGNFPSTLKVPLVRSPSYLSEYHQDPSNETSIMERCLEHIEIFASDGLRTLVYGYRFLSQKEYDSWEALHHQATTSLLNRQNMIESAAEHVERDLQLAGATGIEDKLQVGVPETIEKFQQANIKIWMLTGDKRETAITIAHSAKICKSYSEVIILNGGDESEMAEQMLDTLLNLNAGRIAHSVIVIDGQALVEVEENETLNTRFYELLLKVDSVICCRASPSQKAAMVKRIRQLDSKAITLAIGDGGNDIAMIQEAHVGIGISGKEGLQAARVADYSIAQFRFLQRLLLVHGHWLYVRTAKFILLTFWKEMLFYVVQLLYQRWNGYTGTSLFESWSLAVWNTLFTALPVMIPGVFEQDLSAETLLNIPELYGYGQQSRGFNMRQYWWWMLMAVSEALVIYFMVYGLYGVEHRTGDQGLFALGDLAFSICVVFINVKLLILDYHHKTWIPIFAAILTISGWWAWNLFLSAAYSNSPGVYTVHRAFTQHFDLTWWAVLVIVVMACIVIELCIDVAKRRWWPDAIEIWQEREQETRGRACRGETERSA